MKKKYKFLSIIILLSSGCSLDKWNDYDPLIPPYTFPDTCSSTYYTKIFPYAFDDFFFPISDSLFICSSYGPIKCIDFFGNLVWEYTEYANEAWPGSDSSVFIRRWTGNEYLIKKISAVGSVLWSTNQYSGCLVYPDSTGGCFFSLNDTIARVSSSGSVLWNYVFTGFGSQYFSDPKNMVKPALDGGVIISGKSWVTNGYHFLKLSSLGQKEWESDISIDGTRTSEQVKELVVNQAGYAIFVIKNTEGTLGIYQIDSLGNKVWEKTLPGTKSYYLKYFIAVAGGFLMTGNSGRYLGAWDNNDNELQEQLLAIKLFSSGDLEWVRFYGKKGREVGYYCKELNDGYFFSGNTSALNGGDRSGASKTYVIKTDWNGNTCY